MKIIWEYSKTGIRICAQMQESLASNLVRCYTGRSVLTLQYPSILYDTSDWEKQLKWPFVWKCFSFPTLFKLFYFNSFISRTLWPNLLEYCILLYDAKAFFKLNYRTSSGYFLNGGHKTKLPYQLFSVPYETEQSLQ